MYGWDQECVECLNRIHDCVMTQCVSFKCIPGVCNDPVTTKQMQKKNAFAPSFLTIIASKVISQWEYHFEISDKPRKHNAV